MMNSNSQSQRQQLYFSILGIDRAHLNPRELAFVTALEEQGYAVYLPFEHRDYSIIEQEVDQSSAVVVLANLIWYSSIWKASEVTYALEGCGALHFVKDHKPIPTFIFWSEEPFEIVYLCCHAQDPYLTYLPLDIVEAVYSISAYLRT